MNLGQVEKSQEEFNEVLHKVLSDPKYWRINKKLQEGTASCIERLKKWLEEILTSRIDNMENAEGISEVLSYVIVFVVGIALIVGLIMVILYFYNSVNDRRGLKEILGEQITEETTPVSLDRKALAYEGEGKYRLSIRYSYIALLLLMHERNILVIKDTMTNKEIYDCLVKGKFNDLDRFDGIIKAFNHAWYGMHEYEKEDYDNYRKQFKQLWNEVISHGKN